MDSSGFLFTHGSLWRCIRDPNGLFLGGVFRSVDLSAENEKERAAHWAEGCAFQQLKKQRWAMIVNGRIQLSDTVPTVGPDKNNPGQGDSLTGEGNQHD